MTSSPSPGRSSSSAAATAAWTASGSSPALARAPRAGRRAARSYGVLAITGPPGRSGTAGVKVTWAVPSTSTASKCPDHRASSRSGKSSRQCEPRVSSRSGGRGGQRRAHGEQVGGLPGVLVDELGGVAGQLVQQDLRLGEPGRGAQHADPRRSSPPAARGARCRSAGPACGGRAPARDRGRSSPGRTSAIRREKTSPSRSELEASRLAPCTPEQATSPVAYRPGTLVRPHRSVATPPEA